MLLLFPLRITLPRSRTATGTTVVAGWVISGYIRSTGAGSQIRGHQHHTLLNQQMPSRAAPVAGFATPCHLPRLPLG